MMEQTWDLVKLLNWIMRCVHLSLFFGPMFMWCWSWRSLKSVSCLFIRGENAFKGSQLGIVSFSLFSHGSHKVERCSRGHCGYFLIELYTCKQTHTYSSWELGYGMFLQSVTEQLQWASLRQWRKSYSSSVLLCDVWEIVPNERNFRCWRECHETWRVWMNGCLGTLDCPCCVLLLLAACGAQRSEVQFMLGSHRSHSWLSLLTCNMSCDIMGCVVMLMLDFNRVSPHDPRVVIWVGQ